MLPAQSSNGADLPMEPSCGADTLVCSMESHAYAEEVRVALGCLHFPMQFEWCFRFASALVFQSRLNQRTPDSHCTRIAHFNMGACCAGSRHGSQPAAGPLLSEASFVTKDPILTSTATVPFTLAHAARLPLAACRGRLAPLDCPDLRSPLDYRRVLILAHG